MAQFPRLPLQEVLRNSAETRRQYANVVRRCRFQGMDDARY
jgi:hypothetical protein